MTMEQSSPQPQGLPAEPLKPTPDDAHDSSVVTSRPQTDGTLTDQSQPLSHPSEDATEISGDQPEYITGLKLLTVIVSVTLVVFLLLLDVSILNTAIPNITSDFHSLSDAGWYGGAYQLASACLQPLTGKFYSHFNVKWTFIFFLFFFELGSLISAIATSSPMFIGGRTIAGLGSSGLFNGGMTIIAGAVPLEKRPFYTGIMTGIGEMGVVCGPLIGGAFTEYVTWRWCFYINLPIGGACALLLILTRIPEAMPKPRLSGQVFRQLGSELDLFGFLLFAPFAVMFLLALQFGSTVYAWKSATVIGLFCGAGVALILFFLWESRIGDRAMMPVSFITKRIIACSMLHFAFMMTTISVPSYYLPTYFQSVLGTSPTTSGVNMLPSILSQVFAVVFSGAAVNMFGYYIPWAIGGAAICAAGMGVSSLFSPTTPTGKWIGYQILSGVGRGLGMQMGMVATQNEVTDAQVPVAMALLIFAQNFAGAVFLIVANVVYDQSLKSEIPKLAPSVTAAEALSAGGSASAVRNLLPEGSSELSGLLMAYSIGIDRVFYLCTAIAGAAFVVAWGLGWKNVKSKGKDQIKEKEDEKV